MIANKPWIEIRREIGSGCYRTYATVNCHPFSVWVLGRWIIGGKRVKRAWDEAGEEALSSVPEGEGTVSRG